MATEFEPRVRHFLEGPGRHAVLATINPDGSPLQAVVWYLVKADGLVVNSLNGRRWPQNLRRDPRYSLTVEDGLDYVALRGEAELLDDAAQAQEDIAAMARRYHTPEDAEQLIANTFRPQRRESFRLRARTVTLHGDIE
ncbi:hypothetical protein BH24CHL8_BH24CHL8_03200 [soil metagenome]